MRNEKARLVILDDEEHIIRLLKNLIPWDELPIEFAGSAGNGVEGRALILKSRPDLIITDIRMPGIDGLSLISDVRARMPETDFVIVSGFRQFDYARRAILYGVENYLLKPVNREELRDTLRKLSEKKRLRRAALLALEENGRQKRNALFSRLLFSPESCPPSRAEELFAARKESAALCAAKIDSGENSIPERLRRLLTERIGDALRRHSVCRAVSFGRHIVWFLCAAGESRGEEIFGKLPPLFLDLRKITDAFPRLRLTLFFSGLAEQNLDGAYRSLLRALPFRRRKDAPQMIRCGRFLSAEFSGAGKEFRAEKELSGPLLEAWSKDCAGMLDRMDSGLARRAAAGFVLKIQGLPENQAEELLFAAARRLAVRAEERCPERRHWFGRVLAPALDLAGTAEELAERFCGEISRMIAETGASLRAAAIRPVRQADDYMAAHYMDYDMSLETVAENVALTPSYFSALYRKETGTGFLKALTAVRMRKAKELLRSGTETVAEIASAVGYTDAKYFSRIFKKTTGIAPNEFRRLYH